MILYTITLLSQFILVTLVLVRPGRKQYPLFRLYVTYLLVKDAFLYGMTLAGMRDAYFYSYYTFALVESILALGAVLEVVRELFFPLEILPGCSAKHFIGCVTGITTVCLITGVMFPCRYPHMLFSAAWTLERTATALECGCLWIVLGFALRLGIPFRKRLLGIMAGLMFQSTIAAVALANVPGVWVGRIVMTSGLVTMLGWTYSWILPEPVLVSLKHLNIPKLPCASDRLGAKAGIPKICTPSSPLRLTSRQVS